MIILDHWLKTKKFKLLKIESSNMSKWWIGFRIHQLWFKTIFGQLLEKRKFDRLEKCFGLIRMMMALSTYFLMTTCGLICETFRPGRKFQTRKWSNFMFILILFELYLSKIIYWDAYMRLKIKEMQSFDAKRKELLKKKKIGQKLLRRHPGKSYNHFQKMNI